MTLSAIEKQEKQAASMELPKVFEEELPGEDESSVDLQKVFGDEIPGDDGFSVAHSEASGGGDGDDGDGEGMTDYNKAHQDEERKTLMGSITNKAVKYLRVIVYLVVVITTIMCCLLVYHFTREEEEKNFEDGFIAYADKMAE